LFQIHLPSLLIKPQASNIQFQTITVRQKTRNCDIIIRSQSPAALSDKDQKKS